MDLVTQSLLLKMLDIQCILYTHRLVYSRCSLVLHCVLYDVFPMLLQTIVPLNNVHLILSCSRKENEKNKKDQILEDDFKIRAGRLIEFNAIL